MPTIRKILKLTATGFLVAGVTISAYFAGFGAGTRVQAYPGAPAPEDSVPEIGAQVPATQSSIDEDSPPFGVFWEAWHLLEDSYYGDLPEEQAMTYGAIRGVLGLLDDRHTTFLDPGQAAVWQTELHGAFEGIGAVVDEWPEGGVLIVEPFDDQPAIKAGLRSGDVILAVDGQDVTEMDLDAAISLIRGPAGSAVRLLVRRPDVERSFEVEVVRGRVQIAAVRSAMLEDGVGYLRLNEFTSRAPGEVETALEALTALQPRGLVFDLRGNPGGLLSSAVEVASFFVGGDIVVERSEGGVEQHYPAEGEPLTTDVPLVVLVNGRSASASEIVAGAIQDNGRGLLVGEQTFGKGSVQTPYTLSDGSMLRVSTARWFTPNDRAIHGVGLVPDVVVEIAPGDMEAGRDPQLERALDILLSNESPEALQ